MASTDDNFPLGEGFTPGEFDVILSSGGTNSKLHNGNVDFRSTIKNVAPRYRSARGKLAKSLIVSEIIEMIKQKSSNVGFVKRIGMQWFRVNDLNTRERVSQALRDELQSQYRSSSGSRKRRRDAKNVQSFKEIQSLVESNPFISERMRKLSAAIQTGNLSDEQLERLMTQTCRDILDHLKADGVLLQMAAQLAMPR